MVRKISVWVCFIAANLPHTSQYTKDLLELVNLYKQTFPEVPREIADFTKEIELEFIEEDLPHIFICDKLRKSANCQGGRPKKVK